MGQLLSNTSYNVCKLQPLQVHINTGAFEGCVGCATRQTLIFYGGHSMLTSDGAAKVLFYLCASFWVLLKVHEE